MHIIGTAGHVDHGKSALVAALTGTNPDRLIEERERGMTLDLGFAHLRFDDGLEAGIVDVPGHERFLHNMLAGAAGMELLLLVVDVSEGVMPQTLEHLAILRYLNVASVLVVASKTDLVDPVELPGALGSITDALADTIAADAPILPVSVVSGEGLRELKLALRRELEAMPARDVDAPVYLPIDRVFMLPGIGTIVTGTLMQGRIETGDRLNIEPGGTASAVRSIGVFDAVRDCADAGTRVALSLPSVDRRDILRGHAVVGRELSARRTFAVRFLPLPNTSALLRRRTPVRTYIGSAEVLGTLVAGEPYDGEREIAAQLHLREPVVAFPGLRFVVRRPSPMTLLGGGYVEGVEPSLAEDGATPEERAVLGVLRSHGLEAIDPAAIAFEANLRESAVFATLKRLVENGEAVHVARPRGYLDGDAARTLLAGVLAHLGDAQRDEPWAMGVTSLALARTLGVDERLLIRLLAEYVEQGRLQNRDGYFSTLEHEPSFSAEQRMFFSHLVPLDENQSFLPIPFSSAAAAVKLSNLAGISKAFETMLARGQFVKVGDDLYLGSQISRIIGRVEADLRERSRMTMADFRDLLGTSRKYAVPLLEWLDAHGVTIRDGDYRTLRKIRKTIL